TLGAILGAVLAGFVLVPLFGTQTTLLVVAVGGTVAAVVLALAGERRQSLVIGTLAAAALVVVAAFVRPDWQPQAMNVSLFEPGRFMSKTGHVHLTRPNEEVVYYREGRTATVVVNEID